MVGQITLGKALNTTLLSLQKTGRLIDDTTRRLSTGLKVSTALDQPQNFFQAQSLKNRAGDFNRLLDGISQSIRTIEEGVIGTEALEKLINQAKAVTSTAEGKLKANPAKAELKGSRDLVALGDLTNYSGIDNADSFALIVGDGDGNTVQSTITISNGDRGDSLVAQINSATNIRPFVRASLNDSGQLQIVSLVGDYITIDSSNNNADFNTMRGLGLDEYVDSLGDGTIVPDNFLITQSLYRTAAAPGGAGLAQASDRIVPGPLGSPIILRGEDGGLFGARADTIATGDSYTISVNGQSVTYSYSTGVNIGRTIQGFIDGINNQAEFKGLIEAEFLEKTGQIVIRPLSEDVRQINFTQTDFANDNLDTAFKFNGSDGADSAPGDGNNDGETLTFGQGIEPLTNLEEDYGKIIAQINFLTEDASYRGVNLLAGNDLTTRFNPDGSNSLTTRGSDFSSSGLGIEQASFSTTTNIQTTQDDLQAATLKIRSFGTALSNDLGIIQTRKTFTQALINTHLAGADDLTVADSNEEGANLLALQTRQALGTTALSLASQSQQAVLNLF